MQRSDPHSPSSLIPADYSFLFGYAHPSSVDGWPIPGINMALLLATRSGKRETAIGLRGLEVSHPLTRCPGRGVSRDFPITFSDIHKGGACDICGAWHIEGSVFLHQPTGKAIAIGWQCAKKLELDFDESEKANIAGERKAARSAVIAKAKKRAHLREFVAIHHRTFVLRALKLDHHITRSIRAQVLRGRDLTRPQIELLLKIDSDDQRLDEPEEARVAAPICDSRIVVEGTVVGLKVHENSFGSSLKMTVKVTEPNGVWLCWGTVPAGLESVRGAVVRFTARITVSPTDESFSFFKRPTQASIVKLGPEGIVDLDRLQSDLELIKAAEDDSGSWYEGQVEKAAALELLR